MNEIRKYMNLIESTLVEQVSQNAVEMVLDYLKTLVDEELISIKDIVWSGYLDDMWQDWIMSNEVTDEEAKILKKYSSDKWEKLFKNKFGQSSQEIINAATNELISTLSDQEMSIIKILASKMITGTKSLAKDIVKPESSNKLVYYIRSPKSVVVFYQYDTNYPKVNIGENTFSDLEMSLKDFVEWMDSRGIKKVKRPTSKRYSGSYYD